MHRRKALKNVAIGLGYITATPTILNMLVSCTDKESTWTPLFLTLEEKHIVTHLVDVIIPVSEIPGALDVNVPQFIDLIYNDIKSNDEKTLFKSGCNLFSKDFSKTFIKEASEGNKDDFEQILSTYFNLSNEDCDALLKQQKQVINNISETDIDKYTVYKFLLSVRYYSIFGFINSDKIGEEILAYDPIPGTYNGCLSVSEATNGRAWSL